MDSLKCTGDQTWLAWLIPALLITYMGLLGIVAESVLPPTPAEAATVEQRRIAVIVQLLIGPTLLAGSIMLRRRSAIAIRLLCGFATVALILIPLYFVYLILAIAGAGTEGADAIDGARIAIGGAWMFEFLFGWLLWSTWRLRKQQSAA